MALAHILSILLEAGWGISAQTCVVDYVIPELPTALAPVRFRPQRWFQKNNWYFVHFVFSVNNDFECACFRRVNHNGTILSCRVVHHYSDVIMSTMASQITSVSIVHSTVSSGADQRKRQSSASLAFVRGIHRPPVNSPHKGPVTRKTFVFDDVIMMQLGENSLCNFRNSQRITLTPYTVLRLFATRFADYAGGIPVSFMQPRLF